MTKAIVRSALCFGLVSVLMPNAKAADAPAAVQTHNRTSIWIDSESGIDTTIYYTCTALEDHAKDILKKLGATNISVQCDSTTGNPDEPSYAPTLRLSFDSVRLASSAKGTSVPAKWSSVKVHDSNNCEPARQIMNGVVKYFEIQHFSGTRSCMRSDDAYSYSFTELVRQ